MKKTGFIIGLFFFSFSVNAQLSFEEMGGGLPQTRENKEVVAKLTVINSIVSYAGAIVGYANACNLPKEKSSKIERSVFKKLDEMSLSIPDKEYIKKNYYEVLKGSEKKAPSLSKNECIIFAGEFDKIVASIDKF